MLETPIAIRTADGTCDGFLIHQDDKPRPAVVHLTDIFGIRPPHHEMARRLAALGYTVLLPNIFYRTGKPPMFDFPFQMGEERSMKRFMELASPLTPDAVERDGNACVDFLRSQATVVSGGIGVTGYCFSGAMALRIAAARPNDVVAAASFHGGRLFLDTPTSPHLVLPRIKARLYFGHASNDQLMPAEAIVKLEAALAAWGGKYESETYAGAAHGWTVPGGPAYNEAQAERAFTKLSGLLTATLRA
jgi:carboxymethylenebutenolidase